MAKRKKSKGQKKFYRNQQNAECSKPEHEGIFKIDGVCPSCLADAALAASGGQAPDTSGYCLHNMPYNGTCEECSQLEHAFYQNKRNKNKRFEKPRKKKFLGLF